MPEPTSPAASTIALSVKAAPPSSHVPGVPTLAAFCEVLLGKIVLPGDKAPKGDGERQDNAATGNALPEKDKDVDPALAWLFGAQPVVTPVPAPAPSPAGANAATPAMLEAAPDIAPDILMASGVPDAKTASTGVMGCCDADAAKPRMFTLPDVTAQPIKLPDATPQPIKPPPLPLQFSTDRAVNPQPIAAALPALFALSMADRGDRDDKTISSLSPVTTAALPQPAAMPVAPMADAQRQMLDMGRQDWPQKMIDHIEALRDNANANDTSIRLKPEALGRVDIALKTHDDGAISVRFTAEQPATRTLLVDATPQLSAAAEARGIRLSGTSVDLSGQGDQRPQPQSNQAPDRARPAANRLAPSRGDDNQTVDDGRIA